MEFKKLFRADRLPTDIQLLYGGLIKKRVRLKKAWQAVILKNNLAYMFNDNGARLSFGGIRRIFGADDGKFMLVKENGQKAVFDTNGKYLSSFSSQNELFPNGWYKIYTGDGLSLFDAEGNCIGKNLAAAGVFKNGCYFMSVLRSEDATQAGVFNADGKRLLFSNDNDVQMLGNGWFIADNGLYDNIGNAYIGMVNGHTLDGWFLKAVGHLMPRRQG